MVGGIATISVSTVMLFRKMQSMWASEGEGISKSETGQAGADANRVVIDNLRFGVESIQSTFSYERFLITVFEY